MWGQELLLRQITRIDALQIKKVEEIDAHNRCDPARHPYSQCGSHGLADLCSRNG